MPIDYLALIDRAADWAVLNRVANQATFDKAAGHFATQKTRSVDSEDMMGGSICSLRGELGRKCAIGIFIPDKDYRRSLEGDLESATKIALRHTSCSRSLLVGLQRTHDRSENWTPEAMPAVLRELAATQGLNADGLADLDFSGLYP
jgi:hypothetical protein